MQNSKNNLLKMLKLETAKKANKIKWIKANITKPIFLGLVMFIIYSIPFIHNNFGELKEWEPYSSHYKTFNVIINESNLKKETLLIKLEKGEIDKLSYIGQLRDIKKSKKAELTLYKKKKRNLKAEYSFMGYSSFRYFLYATGLSLFALSVSIFLLVFVFNPDHVKKLKKFYLVSSIGFIYVSSFWFLRSFLTRTDFPKWAYNLSFVIAAIVSSAIVFALVYFFNKIELKKKQRVSKYNNIKESLEVLKSEEMALEKSLDISFKR